MNNNNGIGSSHSDEQVVKYLIARIIAKRLDKDIINTHSPQCLSKTLDEIALNASDRVMASLQELIEDIDDLKPSESCRT